MTEPVPLPSEPAALPAPAPASAPKLRRRSWRRRLLALGVGLLLPLLLLELGARLLWSRLAPPLPGADDPVMQVVDPLSRGEPLGRALRREALASPTAYLLAIPEGPRDMCLELGADHVPYLRPGARVDLRRADGVDGTWHVRVDQDGLRGPERGPPPEGALRVLLLGDSMTFGSGVADEDTYAARLEPLLAAALARPVRVGNGGIIAFGPQEELRRLEALRPRLQPDLVVAQLTIANDPLDALRWLDEPGPLRPDPQAARALEDSLWLNNPLAWWSRAYRWAAWNVGRHALRYRLMSEPAVLERTVALIERMRALVAPRPFAVLLAPTVGQAQGHRADRLLDTEAINRGLSERLAARGIPCLDPLPRLRAGCQAGQVLYLPFDRHWSPLGHQAVAEELAPFLQGLLRDSPR